MHCVLNKWEVNSDMFMVTFVSLFFTFVQLSHCFVVGVFFIP
jgi:hypothetical protein